MNLPQENQDLIGHQQAKDIFLQAFHSERFAHAWILAGPVGIGKATFAFHMARYILSGRKDGNTQFDVNDPLCRRIVAQSHGDLHYITDEDGKEISVETVRNLNNFLNQTPAEGGWRVVIIDGADKLNRNASNALLKRLEEPPQKTVFMLTTSFPGRLLTTIRSRCQVLNLNPLSGEDVKKVLEAQRLDAANLLSLAQGSPGRLIRLIEGEGASIYADLQKVLHQGEPATSLIHKYGGEDSSYSLIEDIVRDHVHANLLSKVENKASLDQALEVYEKIEELLNQARFAQLDRKATLTCVFSSLKLH
jgi:DNA polymerase-3 subunit delta'